MTLGQTIRKVRQKKGYSLKQVEIKSGISASLICKWELDKNVPTIHSLIKLADGLKISLDELVGRV